LTPLTGIHRSAYVVPLELEL
jgi:hypothetical protein